MKYRIKIFCVGKPLRGYLEEGVDLYTNRLKANAEIEWVIVKSDKELIEKLKEISYICFDVLGKPHSSESFSEIIQGEVSHNFVIGGACGIPPQILNNAKGLISFSRFTFPHELVRLLVAEQLYRAIEIAKNTPYHK
jgi:23S rRNA (pseudouridine1915-N3)-methyltransferase